MKIAIVINTAWNIYNFRMGLIRFFQSKGIEVVAIAPEDEFSKELKNKTSYYPIPMQQKGTNPFNDLLLVVRLYRLYKKVSPDYILHYTIKPNIYGTIAASMAGIPCINNVSGLGTVFLHDTFSTKLAKLLYRFAFHFPKKVFFQNQDDLDLFIEKKLVRYEKADVLPGSGIDLQFFQFEKMPQSKPFTFLVIARLLYDKGIIEYAEAATLLKAKYPTIQFVLAGALDCSPKLGIPKSVVDTWSQISNINYIGFVDDVKTLVSNAHCVVLPSYREGTPRSLLEALAIGRPIVTTDVPGCKEVVINGYNGFLCLSGSSKDLADKMESMFLLSASEVSLMGQNSRSLAVEKFSEQIVFSKYFEALQKEK